MLILNKKRILIVFLCIISVFFVGERKRNKTLETVALPVENKVIILDAGHGFPDERGI